MKVHRQWKEWASRLRAETYAIYLAYRDPRTPWYARVLALVVVAYAVSPIDLIPDAIPLLGYLDDLVLVPAGIALAVRLIPQDVMDECRERARDVAERGLPGGRAAAAAVLLVWVAVAALVGFWILRAAGG